MLQLISQLYFHIRKEIELNIYLHTVCEELLKKQDLEIKSLKLNNVEISHLENDNAQKKNIYMKECYCMGNTEQTRKKNLDKKKCIFLENACREHWQAR